MGAACGEHNEYLDCLFRGWYGNSSKTGTKYTQITKGTTGNKDFYAKYEQTNCHPYACEIWCAHKCWN